MLSRLKHAMTRVPGYKGRYLIVSAVILALLVPGMAVGFGEGKSVLGGKRNPSTNASRSYSRETEIIASTDTYGTRQSNKNDGDGGGAIYGCRSNPGREPCLRGNNLKGGRAFEFSTVGNEAGRIEVGGNRTGPPLTTNATGVATGFNADKVDGKDATDFAAKTDVDAVSGALKFAVVSNNGSLEANRGATGASVTSGPENTVTVTFSTDVSKCSYTATPAGTANAADAVAVSAGSDPKTVVVDQPPDPVNPSAFHLQVIC
jgi:hypothetical protein